MDQVFIDQLTVYPIIGCLPFEATVRQPVLIDVVMTADCSKAGHSDNLTDAIDYAKAVAHIEAIAKERHFHLVEALAETLSESLLATFAVTKVKLRITKPHILPRCKGVGVEIERQRG